MNGHAENGLVRILVPFKVAGIQQILHFDPPLVTNPTAKCGPRTSLGDMQIYNFTITKHDLGLFEPVTFGIGPLLAVPTSTSTNFGTNNLQAGFAGVILAPRSGGSLVCSGPISTRWEPAPHGYTLNAYAEAQPSVYRAGDGAPNGALRASRGALATEGVHGPDNALGSSAVAKAQANHNDHNPR